MKCHRCGTPMTLYVLGLDYCQLCRREMAERDRKPPVRNFGWRPINKDMTPGPRAA